MYAEARHESNGCLHPDEHQAKHPAGFDGAVSPHALQGEEHSERVAIGWGQDPGDHNDLLINLQLEIPAFFSRFQRVAEVVTQDEGSLNALRQSWQFYRDRGYQLERHDL